MRTRTHQTHQTGRAGGTRASQLEHLRFQQLVEIPVDVPGGRSCCARALMWMPQTLAADTHLRGSLVISVAGFEWVVHRPSLRRSRVSLNYRLPAA